MHKCTAAFSFPAMLLYAIFCKVSSFLTWQAALTYYNQRNVGFMSPTSGRWLRIGLTKVFSPPFRSWKKLIDLLKHNYAHAASHLNLAGSFALFFIILARVQQLFQNHLKWNLRWASPQGTFITDVTYRRAEHLYSHWLFEIFLAHWFLSAN